MDKMRMLRKEAGLTQKELGERLSLAEATVSHYELGLRSPDNEKLNDIADFFGCSVDYLLGRTTLRNAEKEFIAACRIDGLPADIPDELLRDVRKYAEYLWKQYEQEKSRV
jgi:transcriptional regulator with XRE-family HTH domain